MLLLDTPRPVTFEQIVEDSGLYPDRGESSRKAFERDKSSLRSMGVEIATDIEEGDRGATRYRIDPDDYFLPDLELTDDERLALQLGAAMVQMESSWDDAALLKMGQGAQPAAEAVVAEVPSLDQLPTLHQAMRTRVLAQFGYRGRSRVVVPRGLFYREGNWYLAAREQTGEGGEESDRTGGEESDRDKVFRVDRIEGNVTLGSAHDHVEVEDFDPSSVMPDDPLLIGGEGEVVALVEIGPVMAARVERQRGGVVERRPDGSVVVEVAVRNRDAFRSWVLGLRDHARVLEPDEMVDEVVRWLHALAGEA